MTNKHLSDIWARRSALSTRYIESYIVWGRAKNELRSLSLSCVVSLVLFIFCQLTAKTMNTNANFHTKLKISTAAHSYNLSVFFHLLALCLVPFSLTFSKEIGNLFDVYANKSTHEKWIAKEMLEEERNACIHGTLIYLLPMRAVVVHCFSLSVRQTIAL